VSNRNSRSAKAARREQRAQHDAQNAYNAALKCGHCTGRYREAGPQGPGVYHDAGCPVLSGAADPAANARRAAAAAAELAGRPVADSELAGLAEFGAEFARTMPAADERGPRTAAVTARFDQRAAAGTLQRCPHLGRRTAPPGGAHWVPWAPDRVSCAACLTALSLRATGGPGENACDSCGEQAPVTDSGEVLVHIATATRGNVSLHVTLCEPCRRADGAAVTGKEA
jgi:hypothetical protein